MDELTLKAKPGIVAQDPWLDPYEDAVRWRRRRFAECLARLADKQGRLADVASGHHDFGIHATPEGFYYREWAPAATALFLIGDFNAWDRRRHPLRRTGAETWEIFLPRAEYERTFTHGSRVKVHVVSEAGAQDRIPLYARRVVQDPVTTDFAAQVWLPPPFPWSDAGFVRRRDEPPLIYEAHVGMAQEREGIGTYAEFTASILPRIAADGYNTVQLMAVAEHPYYGSFGYHVTNFFAPSSRFGTPEDLKALVDRAHGLGLAVYMDVVHSHAATNAREGLSGFDGTVHQFFHAGGRGEHPLWDSKLFDYGKPGVQRFLLSNLKYWLVEFHFDGFRFDGVTSMLYLHHGLGTGFDHYDKYFLHGVDVDGVTYLQLANQLVREVRPAAVTIAEDVSGMPGLAAPQEEGGIGFDYRLAMGLPDYWFQLVRSRRDEDWRPSEILGALLNRRHTEKHIAYVESHDQSLVGDKTLAFMLMDSAMYWHMRVDDPNLIIDRGLALHKLIRLVTLAAGGDGYLNFMGNEFGHPEWVDFPREGNGWSYKFARRQWSLVDNPDLKYKFLLAFDHGMLELARSTSLLKPQPLLPHIIDDAGQTLVFSRGGLIFCFNFHPTASYADYAVGIDTAGSYRVRFDSDTPAFGGHGRVDPGVRHLTQATPLHGKPHTLKLYLPSRTAVILSGPDPAA